MTLPAPAGVGGTGTIPESAITALPHGTVGGLDGPHGGATATTP